MGLPGKLCISEANEDDAKNVTTLAGKLPDQSALQDPDASARSSPPVASC